MIEDERKEKLFTVVRPIVDELRKRLEAAGFKPAAIVINTFVECEDDSTSLASALTINCPDEIGEQIIEMTIDDLLAINTEDPPEDVDVKPSTN